MRKICERSVLVKAGKSDETNFAPLGVWMILCLGGAWCGISFQDSFLVIWDHKSPWKTPCLYDLVVIYKPWYGFKKNKTIYAC